MGYAKSSGNYGVSMLPARKALEEGFDQLIWTDAKEHKYVEERRECSGPEDYFDWIKRVESDERLSNTDKDLIKNTN